MSNRHLLSSSIALLATGLLCLNVALAKGPPTKVTVTHADPPSALQGELLTVEITGSGFDKGSTVKFLVTETKDDTQISVDQSSVKPNEEGTLLTVDIEVSGQATVIGYDIEVQAASSGRRGKGTTLFTVKQKGGGSSDPTYKVDIFGAVKGMSKEDWIIGSRNTITRNEGGGVDFGLVGELKDLSFFVKFFDAIQTGYGTNCFTGTVTRDDAGEDGDGRTFTIGNLNQGIVGKGRGGRAESSFWFFGKTRDNSLPVLYRLDGFGQFVDVDGALVAADDDVWPPAGINDTTYLSIPDWKISTQNVGKNVKNISCIGEGSFTDPLDPLDPPPPPPPLLIGVTRTN